MDAETLKSMAGLLSGGGSAAVIFLLWIAYNTLQRMRKAAEDLQDIRDAVTAASPVVRAAAQNIRDMAADLESVDARLQKQELQLIAALNRQPPGATT